MRLLLAMMKHETNTFSPVPTPLDRFRAWGLHEGEAVVKAYRGTNHPIAAYIALADEAGAEIVTPVAAEAMPSGIVHREAYTYLCDRIANALEAGGFDAVLLDLHGAMVAEGAPDGEGALLARLRKINPHVPIGVTFDMHGNITREVIENATAVVCYKSYPHTDMAAVGRTLGRIILDTVEGKVTPRMAYAHVPVLAQTLRMGTADAPMRHLQQMTRDEEAKGCLAASIFGGFPMADVPVAGTSVVTVAADQATADAARDRLAAAVWAARADFFYRHEPLAEAVARAKAIADGPVILLDHADNVGSGGTSDVMTVIAELIRQGLEDVAVATVWDPAAVTAMQAAGVGATLTLDLGGKTAMPALGLAGRPLRLTGVVRRLSDGGFIVRGPMYTGSRVTTGPTALFEAHGLSIVVTSLHHEPWDAGIFRSLGIEPTACRYLLLKSRIHYRAGFGDMPKATLTLDGEGVTTSDNSVLSYSALNRPIYPFDPDMVWSPGA